MKNEPTPITRPCNDNSGLFICPRVSDYVILDKQMNPDKEPIHFCPSPGVKTACGLAQFSDRGQYHVRMHTGLVNCPDCLTWIKQHDSEVPKWGNKELKRSS
jgi:hypothetical protein